jgi:hypothetical protein
MWGGAGAARLQQMLAHETLLEAKLDEDAGCSGVPQVVLHAKCRRFGMMVQDRA